MRVKTRFAVAIVAAVAMLDAAYAGPGDIQTIAGGAGAGAATNLSLRPLRVAAHDTGVWVADVDWAVIRRIDVGTGEAVVVGGSGIPGFSGDGGPATAASISPADIAIDSQGNIVLAESTARIRRIDMATGIITTMAGTGVAGFGGDGGPATSAQISAATGIAVDGAGTVYVADTTNNRIRRIDVVSGIIETIAGTGAGASSGDGGSAVAAEVNAPRGIAIDAGGDVLFTDGDRIRKIDVTTGLIDAVAGTGTSGFSGDGGPATGALLVQPSSVAANATGDVFIADTGNQRIRRVDAATGVITTVAGDGAPSFSGDGGSAIAASLLSPQGVAVDGAGNLVIADTENHRVRRVVGGAIDTIAGNGLRWFGGDGGPALDAQIRNPHSLAFDSAGGLAISDEGRIRFVDGSTGTVTTIAGTGVPGYAGDGGPATEAQFGTPPIVGVYGLAYDPDHNLVIADTFAHRVRRIDAATGVISTIAGNGAAGSGGDGSPATAASIATPTGLAFDTAGNLFVASGIGYRVRRIDATTGIITTVAGNGEDGTSGDGGPATAAAIGQPFGVAVDGVGNLYISAHDYSGPVTTRRVLRVRAATGTIETFAGGGTLIDADGVPATSVRLNAGGPLAFDAAGNLFIGESNRVRRIDPSGRIYAVAGNGVDGFAGDEGPAPLASISSAGIAFDAAENLAIADIASHRVRRVIPPMVVCGDGAVEPGVEECDDGGQDPGDGCESTCHIETETVSDTVGPGGTVTLDTAAEGATPAKPVQAAVTTPSGGEVTITRAGAGGSDAGFRAIGASIVIAAPVESVAMPLQIDFRLDASLLTNDQDETTVQVTRNTVSVPDCTGAPQAIPDPCVSSRVRLAADSGQARGDVVLTILTSAASTWAFAVDVCGTTPATGCLASPIAGKGRLQIRRGANPAKDAVAWKWAAGTVTEKADFGDPGAVTDYALCLYDEIGSMPVRRLRVAMEPGGACSGKPCWRESSVGWQYKKADFQPKGQLQLKMRSGVTGKAQIALKARGFHLGLPVLPLFQDSLVRIQLRNGAGRCWESRYGTSTLNDETGFAAKSD